MARMTPEQQFERLVFVAEWSPEAVEHLRQTCASKGLTTPEELLGFAQTVSDNQCLSVLRGGDPTLDAMVAEALGVPQGTELLGESHG